MKKRTVIVTLELETSTPLSALRDRIGWEEAMYDLDEELTVRQVTATVAPPVKGEKAKR